MLPNYKKFPKVKAYSHVLTSEYSELKSYGFMEIDLEVWTTQNSRFCFRAVIHSFYKDWATAARQALGTSLDIPRSWGANVLTRSPSDHVTRNVVLFPVGFARMGCRAQGAYPGRAAGRGQVCTPGSHRSLCFPLCGQAHICPLHVKSIPFWLFTNIACI